MAYYKLIFKIIIIINFRFHASVAWKLRRIILTCIRYSGRIFLHFTLFSRILSKATLSCGSVRYILNFLCANKSGTEEQSRSSSGFPYFWPLHICRFLMVVPCRSLSALSGSFHASTVNWSLFSASPKTMRITVAHALSPARTARTTWCSENKPCTRSHAEASLLHKRETTVKSNSAKWNNHIQMCGLELIPSETTWEVKTVVQKTITSVRWNTHCFLAYSTPQFTARHLREQHLVHVSFLGSYALYLLTNLCSFYVFILWNIYALLLLLALERGDFLRGGGDGWPLGDHAAGEDSSNLDYMLALSLQSDGEPVTRGAEGNMWSNIWGQKAENSSGTSSFSKSGFNQPNLSGGTNTGSVQDESPTGKILTGFNTKSCAAVSLITSNCLLDTMLPCEFCEELFPEEDLILHQVGESFFTH